MSGRDATTVAYGTPPAGYSYDDDTRAVRVHFHEFAHYSTDDEVRFKSPYFTCFERKWRLSIFPGGDDESDHGKVAVFLTHYSLGKAMIEFSFEVKDSDGKQIAYWTDDYGFDGRDRWGESDFARRSKLLDAVVNETLIIEVKMKVIEATDTPVPPFVPENPLCKNILKKFLDEKSSDVGFEVCTEPELGGGARTRKKAKVTPTTFYAHRLILQDCAPDLAELCQSGKESSAISITNVKPDIFRHMLFYIYGGKLLDEELKANAKDIIEAADRFGVVNLKLEAEACYAASITLTVDNMLDNLLYADAKNCALLKEVVMDFIVENGNDIIGKVSFENVPGSMMNDLLTAMTRGKKNSADSGDKYNTMRVSALRKMLHEKGLDIDGSRETMVARLKENT